MTNQTHVRDFDKMMMRLPPGMRDRIAEAAKNSGRSMNAEVIARLEKSFEDDSETRRMQDLVVRNEAELVELRERLDRIDSLIEDMNRYGLNPRR